MSFHRFFDYFFRSGAPLITLPTAGVLTDLQLPATASNVCMTDAKLGGVGQVPPPNKNPGYAGGLSAYSYVYLIVVGLHTVDCHSYDQKSNPAHKLLSFDAN